MRYQLVIRPEAELDLANAYQWYEAQKKGLGFDFILAVETALLILQRNPSLYPCVHYKVRRVLLRRFPFGIYYVIKKDLISILAVFHGHRNPKIWKSRIH